MEQQAEEALADSFAVFPALAFLINSDQRGSVLERLSYAGSGEPDALLLFAFLLCASSFLALSSVHVEASNVYDLTHPPAMVRINGVVQTADVWCSKYRPNLTGCLSDQRLIEMLIAVEHAHRIPAGTLQRQAAFLASAEGLTYFSRLQQQLSRMDPLHGANA
jgi:hypothetical protein